MNRQVQGPLIPSPTPQVNSSFHRWFYTALGRRFVQTLVVGLTLNGWPFTAIAKAVGLHRKTVSLYVHGVFSRRRLSRSILDPYKPYLLAR